MGSFIYDIPEEIIVSCLIYTDVEFLLNFQSTCHKFYGIGGSFLWRACCQRDFQFWHRKHDIAAKIERQADEVPWRDIYVERYLTNMTLRSLLEDIIQAPVDRLSRIEQYLDHELDGVDLLLQTLDKCEGTSDVLARRWHSESIISALSRREAIHIWQSMHTNESMTALETCLSAFDIFYSGINARSVHMGSLRLDCIADLIRKSCHDYDNLPDSEKVSRIVYHLKICGLAGTQGNGASEQALCRNFMGLSLSYKSHTPLPLIAVAIFCSVAQRLGLHACPCDYPFRVLAIVYPQKQDQSPLANFDSTTNADNDIIFVDVFEEQFLRSKDSLSTQLSQLGIPERMHFTILSPASVPTMIARCARNIMQTIQNLRLTTTQTLGISGTSGASYAATCALALASQSPNNPQATRNVASFIPEFIWQIQSRYPFDTKLTEDILREAGSELSHNTQYRSIIESIRKEDGIAKQIKRRDCPMSRSVSFNIGQVLVHKRYHYNAVIVGWDIQCAASDDWIAHMEVPGLQHGAQQNFYHVLVEDQSLRYVASENVVIVNSQPPDGLMAIAGQYMKRWSVERQRFVSNLGGEYPDD